jgi:hypothetical protein
VKPGDVVFWPQFRFEDGGYPSDKLLVIVGARGAHARLLLKTTSQPSSYRPDPDGCHVSSSVFRFNTNLAGFEKPTWVQFDPPCVLNADQIEGRVMFTLKPPDLSAIINCYKKSDDISPELAKFCIK